MDSKTGKKYDQNKLRWDLLPIDLLEEIVEIYTFGAQKYGDNQWQNLDDGLKRYYSALMRHLVAWKKGNKIDDESKKRHLAHACWNIIALMYLDREETYEN